jgi:tripartite-type tricarboxylate transporter receptor subunit TctC
MKLTEIPIEVALAAVAALALHAASAGAQAYPNKPVRLIMPVAPGGPSDTAGRVISQKLSAVLGQTIVVDNRAGAGGTIATDYAARAAPDGYTLLFATAGTFVTSSLLYRNLSYDIEKNFAAVSQVSVQPLVMVVSVSLPANSIKEFIALAKSNPGKMNFSSAGNATSGHLGGLVFNKLAGIAVVHVPYKGAGPALTAVMQGEAQYLFDTALTSKPHVDSGRIKALGVAGERRSTALPDVQTFEEAGFPGFTAQTWAGVVVPAGTPRSIVERLHAAVRETVASREVQDTFARFDTRAVGNSPAEFAALISSERKKWRATVAEFNITVQ